MTTLGRIHSLKQFPAIMRGGCRIALTGTPGTGKTTISDILRMEGFEVLSLETLAENLNCLGELDSGESCYIEVVFTPEEIEDYYGEIEVESSDGSLINISLQGEGVPW